MDVDLTVIDKNSQLLNKIPSCKVSKKESLTGGYRLSSVAQKRIVQLHRLLVFERVFSEYLAGQATAEDVKNCANKMLKAGLPARLK